MAKGREGRRGTKLERCYRLAALLAAGESLDRKRVATMLGIGEANAGRHVQALLRTMQLEQSVGRDGLTVVRAAKSGRKAPPTQTIVAACFGSSLASLFANTPFEDRLRGLVDHVLEGVRDQPRYKHSSRQFWFVARGGERALRRNGATILATLVDAILELRLVRVTRKSFSGITEVFKVRPLSLVLHEHQLYLLGLAGSELMNIRFARITAALLLKETFEYPTLDEFDPRLVFKDSLGNFIHDNEVEQISVQHVKLRLSKRWASYVETHRWHETQRHKIDEHGVVLDLHVRTCPDLDRLILGFGEDAEVLEPFWLRERISKKVEAMAVRYGTSAKSRPSERVNVPVRGIGARVKKTRP